MAGAKYCRKGEYKLCIKTRSQEPTTIQSSLYLYLQALLIFFVSTFRQPCMRWIIQASPPSFDYETLLSLAPEGAGLGTTFNPDA